MHEVFQHVLPGMSVMGLFFVAHIMLMDVLREREGGTLTRLLAGPVTVEHFLAAKVIVAGVVCIVAELLLVVISVLFFRMRWGNPIAFATISGGMILAMVGTMTFLHGLARTRNQVDGASTLVIMWMCMMGGSFFPSEALPPFMQAVGRWTINYWAIEGMRAAIDGDSIVRLLKSTAVLSGVGLATLAVGAGMLRRRLRAGESA